MEGLGAQFVGLEGVSRAGAQGGLGLQMQGLKAQAFRRPKFG